MSWKAFWATTNLSVYKACWIYIPFRNLIFKFFVQTWNEIIWKIMSMLTFAKYCPWGLKSSYWNTPLSKFKREVRPNLLEAVNTFFTWYPKSGTTLEEFRKNFLGPSSECLVYKIDNVLETFNISVKQRKSDNSHNQKIDLLRKRRML